jgi:hypothetical protein
VESFDGSFLDRAVHALGLGFVALTVKQLAHLCQAL